MAEEDSLELYFSGAEIAGLNNLPSSLSVYVVLGKEPEPHELRQTLMQLTYIPSPTAFCAS